VANFKAATVGLQACGVVRRNSRFNNAWHVPSNEAVAAIAFSIKHRATWLTDVLRCSASR
jgi:hypothetical protein